MSDYILPVNYLYVDKYSKLFNDLKLDMLCAQRQLETKILLYNECKYLRSLSMGDVIKLCDLVHAKNESDFLSRVIIEEILKLFELSKGNFFAMQTAHDIFYDKELKSRHITAEDVGALIDRCQLDKIPVLNVLLPVSSMKNYNNDVELAFYGDVTYIDNYDYTSNIYFGNY